MFFCNKLFKKQPYYYGFIEHVRGKLRVTIINAKTEKEVSKLSFFVKEKYQSIKNFVENIPKIFGDGKIFIAIAVNVFTFETPEFLNNYKFCDAIKFQLNSIKLPYYFITPHDYIITCLFAAKNITVNQQDTVVCAFTVNDKYCLGEYQFTENGYKFIEFRDVSVNLEPEIIRKTIIGRVKPAKIVATSLIHDDKNFGLLQKLHRIMQKSDNLEFCDFEGGDPCIKGIVEICKWILDNSIIQFYVLSTCRRDYILDGKVGESVNRLSWILAAKNCQLPYESVGDISRSYMKYSLSYIDLNQSEGIYLEPLKLQKNCHRFKLTFKVDINNFYSYQIEPIICDKIVNFPSVLLHKMDGKPKLPVIGFLDNLSVICIYKNSEYQFIDQWNGFAGKELLISFAEEEPNFFWDEALEDLKRKPASIVSDLIKILSIPINKLQSQPQWNFSITKNSENPILIEFENFDGTKKAASPAFLMALLLKEHLKKIKNETGKRPKEIAFCLFNYMDAKQKAGIKDGLKEACANY